MAAPIVVTRSVAATPEKVWPYLSNGALWARWQGLLCEIEPTPGGRFTMTMPDGSVASGHVVDVVENRRIVFTWGWVGTPLKPGTTTVEITLEPDPAGGTIITLAHRGLPDDLVDHHRGGWEHCLGRLAELVGN
jgi:uncharacterized protein YndB with AHSA1/START domain